MLKFPNYNKGISTPIGILIIVLVAVIAGAGILAWQYFISQEESQIIIHEQESSIIDEQELATSMIIDFMDYRMKTSSKGNLDKAKSYLTSNAKESYSQIQFIDFALVGISNPHFSRFEIIETEKLNFDEFKFTVRIYEELTGEGEIGYFDEIITVIIVGEEYLIDSVEKKDYVNIQDKTADWQTYTNEEYRYQIKYPKEWKVRYEADVSVVIGDANSLHYNRIIIRISEMDLSEFILDYNKMTSSSCFQDKKESIVKLSNYKLGEIDAVKMKACSDIGLDFYYIFARKNGRSYIINTGCDQNQPFQDQMLSSFRFLE